jgi:predicted RNA methylase
VSVAGQLGMGFAADTGGEADRSLSQWDTQPETARELVTWAGVRPGDRVLEPSAGKGNVVRALMDAGASVTAIEIDRSRALLCGARAGCFLEYAAVTPFGAFSVVVGNPPYERNLDLGFVLAGLRLAPRVVFVLRLAFLEGKERYARLWSKYQLAGLRVCSERERFEGDVDGTPKSAMAFFDIRHGDPARSIVGWR